MSGTSEDAAITRKRADDLAEELDRLFSRHHFHSRLDAWMHQILIILSVAGGFAALAVGLVWQNKAWLAGTIGAIPSFAALLVRQLHCVKAANWHNRMAHEVAGLRRRLRYELPSTPTEQEIAGISTELTAKIERMTAQWERMTDFDESQSLESLNRPKPAAKSKESAH